ETFGEFEVRAAIVAHEGLTTDNEFGGSDWAVLASPSDVLDLRVRECGGVERYGSFELVVEHQERCHFGHLCVSFVFGLRLAPGFSCGRPRRVGRTRALCSCEDI